MNKGAIAPKGVFIKKAFLGGEQQHRMIAEVAMDDPLLVVLLCDDLLVVFQDSYQTLSEFLTSRNSIVVSNEASSGGSVIQRRPGPYYSDEISGGFPGLFDRPLMISGRDMKKLSSRSRERTPIGFNPVRNHLVPP